MKKGCFYIIVFLLVLSCKKDPPIPYCEEFPDDCVDVREVKDYFYFKLGSWWVYEEEHTGIRDSVYVTETYNDTSSVLFETWLYSTYDGYDYTFWTTGVRPEVKSNMAKKTERSTRVIRAKTTPGDHVAEDGCFLFYPIPGLSTTTSYISGAGIENYHIGALVMEFIYSSYNIEGTTFNNVVYVSEENNPVEEGQPTNHYYSPHVGLIKKELLDSNQIWNLVEYEIIQ